MRRFLAILALAAAVPSLAAQASDLRMTVEKPHFTCEGGVQFYSRVAYRPSDAVASPALPCCDGKIGCAQFLSTNTIVRQSHEWHG
jgi:hypothetical protein